MAQLKKSERRCWLVTAHAPAGTTMRQANDAWNEFVADRTRGALLFHDHFGDTPGGVAVFAPDTPEELRAIRTNGPVEGWDVHCHPLIFAEGRLGFLFQVDFTMIAYRGSGCPTSTRSTRRARAARRTRRGRSERRTEAQIVELANVYNARL